MFGVAVYCLFCLRNNFYQTKYSEDDTYLKGVIQNIVLDDKQMKIYLDEVLINYYINEKTPTIDLQVGDEIKVTGSFSKPKEEDNFNLFNYRNYLLSKKIYYIVLADKIEVLDRSHNWFYILKRKILTKIRGRQTETYLRTFILGDSSKIDKSVMESYQSNGISHLFAVSGMHVSLITTLLIFFLDKLINSKILKYGFIFTFLIIYIFLTNFSPSIIRASCLFICCVLNKSLKLGIKTEYILLYIFGCSMLYNPFYIYNNGFLFSYVISYFLIKFGHISNNYSNYFLKLFITSFISFLAGLPILINSYFNINLLTPIFNLFFVPLVSFVIFPLSLLTFFFPFLDKLFSICISLMESLSLLMERVTLFKINLSHLSYIGIILYYLLILFIINKIKRKEYKYIVTLFIVLFFHHYIRFFDIYPTLSFINVGQGDSILLTLPHGQGNFLIDCADIKKYSGKDEVRGEVANNIIIPYLNSLGINKLNYVIVTHGDYDHIGSLTTIIDKIKINQVIFNSGSINYNEKEAIKKLKTKKIKYNFFSHNMFKIGNDEIMFLNDIDKQNENEDSLIIYAKINGKTILLMGDAGFETEQYLLNEYNIKNVDILKVGHHGSKYSTSTQFLKQVNPKYAVISVGLNNKFNHPDSQVLKKLANRRLYLTSINGSIKMTLKPSILVQTVR